MKEIEVYSNDELRKRLNKVIRWCGGRYMRRER